MHRDENGGACDKQHRATDGAQIIFWRIEDVSQALRVGKTFIYDAIRKKEFPAAVRLGRSTVWPRAEVLAWAAARIAERSAASCAAQGAG